MITKYLKDLTDLTSVVPNYANYTLVLCGAGTVDGPMVNQFKLQVNKNRKTGKSTYSITDQTSGAPSIISFTYRPLGPVPVSATQPPRKVNL